jgi:hypothetical protein
MSMEKRLLLDGIALRSGDVSPGHVECSAAVIANLANAGLTVWDGATVSAGKAADAILVEPLVKTRVSFVDSLIEDAAESGHGFLASILTLMREGASGFGLRASGKGQRAKGWTPHAPGRRPALHDLSTARAGDLTPVPHVDECTGEIHPIDQAGLQILHLDDARCRVCNAQ